MSEGTSQAASPNAHFLVGETPAPTLLKSTWREGAGASMMAHGLVALFLIFIVARAPGVRDAMAPPDRQNYDLIFLQLKGPGGGGGGGGNNTPTPPKKAELPGKEKTTVPVTKPPELKPVEKPKETPPPAQEVNIPVQQITSGIDKIAGVLPSMPSVADTNSMGMGTGPGAGGGNGSGIGPGSGSGLGPGSGGGTGGGVYDVGNGVTEPKLIREVKPQYTADAMRAKVQGEVELEAVVNPDGSVDRIRVTRSLDRTFGLDDQAIKAVRQWRFMPGTLKGQPVPVRVSVVLDFTLR
ncbi:MAG TPA: TonB family protein [Vicinamibacterales bacterium]|jgi:TonB family protein|nr:TonB family protein [Vicinamibacterales bacterium]